MISDNFITECKNMAYGNRLGKLTIDGLDTIFEQDTHVPLSPRPPGGC